ncbi:hypothetical protein [Paenibacillus massiliensis]|uniref:hypothetical protein n=1 Tax=Paenibacillus massiliensis TaxID=225917 RepID=UPI000472E510|nr:hypothetical protein [Paenibacillus massiliensis]
MTCTQDNLIGETMSVPGNINIDVASAQPHGTRRLMLSDNPETLTSTNVPEVDGTLWHDVVHTTDKTVRHRIFGWHYNKTGGPVRIGVTIENKNGAPMRLSQLERELKVVPETASWIIDVGQCIAKSCLAGTMERIRPVDSLQACRGVSLLEQFEVPEGSLAGFVYDLTLTRPGHRGKLDYEIRTVVSKDLTADLREVVSAPLPPVPPPQAHPRGSWSFSETDAIMPEYIIGTSANYRACAASRLDGTVPADLLFTAARSELGPALDNRGQFGVIYHVTIPIYNPLPEERQVRIYANPRGGAFAGSVRLDNTVYGIPLLRNNTQVCRLADITAPPGHSSYSFSFMVAGSASTPLGIYVTSP